MSERWPVRKIGDVISLEYGKPLPKDQRCEEGGFPAYGANGIKCYAVKPFWEKRSIIVGRKGTAGAVNLVEGGFWPLDVTYYVTFNECENDLKFIYYMLSALDLPSLATGVKPGINRNVVYAIERPFPPLAEQKRIVAILDEAFAGIDTAIANTKKNIANARELFESYLSLVFSQRITVGTERILSEVCENLDSKRVPISKSKRKPGDIPYYGASGIVDHVNDYIFDEDLLLVSEDGANLLARTYPIAFSVSGKTWVNNHAHVLRFERTESQRFIEYYLNSISLEPYVSGMAQPKLNQKALNSIKVPFPSIEEQRVIVEKLDEIAAGKEQLLKIYQQKLTALAELKQSLLQKAFSGELTADAAEAVDTMEAELA